MSDEKPVVKSNADKIWDEIKNLPINMFGLPGQVVSKHCKQKPVEPNNLYVTLKSSAVLPSLEAAIAPKFSVELTPIYVIIRRVV